MLLKRSHRYLKCCVFQTTAAKFAKSTLSRTTLTIFFMLVHITTPYYSLITVCRKLFLKLYFYRPQRSCEGYVFTPVCLSAGGGGICRSACWDTTPLPPGAVTPRAGIPQEQAPPSRHPPPQQTATVADGTHPTGMHSCYFYISTHMWSKAMKYNVPYCVISCQDFGRLIDV